jgi:hypothetical protein
VNLDIIMDQQGIAACHPLRVHLEQVVPEARFVRELGME